MTLTDETPLIDAETGQPLELPRPMKWLIFEVSEAPNREWALDLGEIGTNARSALDYLVYQLALDNNSDPESARTQFPIFLDASDYTRGGQRSHREKMLRGVARKHRRIIDKLQPYQRGPKQAADDPLAILRSISDRDKHRDHLPALALIEEFKIRLSHDGENVEQAVPVASTQVYRDGQPLRTPWGMTEGLGDIDIQPVGQPLTVAFQGDRLVTMDDLNRIILHVAGILDSFQRRISL